MHRIPADRSRWLVVRASLAALCLVAACASSAPIGDVSRQDFGKLPSGSVLHPEPGQYVLVSFWATWCAPCRKEVPLLEGLARRYASGKLKVVAVNVGEGRDVVRRFVNTNESLTMQVTYDPRDGVTKRFGVQGLPTVALVDPDDRTVWTHSGYTPEAFAELLRKVKDIVEE